MKKVTILYDYYPIYDAYCRNRGLLFWLLRGGFKAGFTKNNQDYCVYKVWYSDAEYLRLMCDMIDDNMAQ